MAAGVFRSLNEFALYHDNHSALLHNDYRYKYSLPFEKIDDPVALTLFLQNNWYHTITVSVVYYAAIKLLQWFMTDRPPLRLRWTLVLWNLSLALFSVAGFIRFSEDLFHSLLYKGTYLSVCYSVHPHDVAAFWALLFAISKIVELGDTLFIVLRKKPLIFLHYYHHAAVLIYTIHSGAEHTAAGRAFISMNYLAHSVMYSYYTCTAYGLQIPRWIAMGVTTVQTAQMLAGVFISLHVYKIKTETQLPCQQSMGNLYLAFLIYITFAVLFIHFFATTYLLRPRKVKKLE